jgi:hypothetical protein
MNQRLKRWESPRSEGRNDKGKGGSARQRQKKKQFQMLRKKLKGDGAFAPSPFSFTRLERYICKQREALLANISF